MDDARLCIAQDNPQAADRFLDALEEKRGMLGAHPDLVSSAMNLDAAFSGFLLAPMLFSIETC